MANKDTQDSVEFDGNTIDLRTIYDRQDVILANTTQILEMMTSLVTLLNYKVSKKSSAYKRLYGCDHVPGANNAKKPRTGPESSQDATAEGTESPLSQEITVVPTLGNTAPTAIRAIPEPRPVQPNLTPVSVPDLAVIEPIATDIPMREPLENIYPETPADCMRPIDEFLTQTTEATAVRTVSEPQQEQLDVITVSQPEPTIPNIFSAEIPCEETDQRMFSKLPGYCGAPTSSEITDVDDWKRYLHLLQVTRESLASVNIGSSSHPVMVDAVKLLKSAKLPKPVRFILATMDLVFTNDEMSTSNIDGGSIKYGGNIVMKNKLLAHKLSAIYRQAARTYGVNETVLRANTTIRNAINAKCRSKRAAVLKAQLV